MGRDTWTGIDAEQERPVCAARTSGPVDSYKPKVKSSDAQRESEGIVVPGRPVEQNAGGGKGPCGRQDGGWR
jgi:hypothetical protein